MKIAVVRGRNPNISEFQVLKSLSKDHQVKIIASFGGNGQQEVEGLNPQIYVKNLDSYDRLLSPLPYRARSRLIFYIDEVVGLHTPYWRGNAEIGDCDIINLSDTYCLHCYQAARARERNGGRLVVTVWENIPFRHQRALLGKAISDYVVKRTDRYLAVTERAREKLLMEGVPQQKIARLPMGVNLEFFRRMPRDRDLLARFGLTERDFVVLLVGRILWAKGIYELLFAARRLLNRSNPMKFLVIGSGREISRVRKMVRRLGLQEDVILTGGLPFHLMPKVHNLADVFVAPSLPSRFWQEQFGMALVESMACGKPVVGTFSGSIPEVIGDSGVLVPPADFRALADAL